MILEYLEEQKYTDFRTKHIENRVMEHYKFLESKGVSYRIDQSFKHH